MLIDAENNDFHYSLYFVDKKSPNREIEVMNIDRWVDLTPQTREGYIAHYQDKMGPHHVHGANLRSSSEAYFAMGGFAHIPCHQYANLIEKFEAQSYAVTWHNRVRVMTSRRLNTLANEGFTAFLNILEQNNLH